MKIACICLGLLFAASASAAPERVACAEGPYHAKPFALTFDAAAGTLELSTGDFVSNVEITENTVHWSYMRGFATYHRDRRLLEWDARAQRSYLETIGHPGPQPYSWYVGTARCEATK